MPTKAHALATRLETLEQKRTELENEILAAQEAETAALTAAISTAPEKGTGALRSSEQIARKKRADAEKALENLEADLRVTKQLLDEASQRETEDAVASLVKEAQSWDKAEATIWKRAGDVLAALDALWNELQDVLSQRAGYFGTKATEQGSVGARQRVEELASPFIAPTPNNRESFAVRVFDALDGHGRPIVPSIDPGEREPGIPAAPLQPVIDRHLDAHDRLWKVIEPLTEDER